MSFNDGHIRYKNPKHFSCRIDSAKLNYYLVPFFARYTRTKLFKFCNCLTVGIVGPGRIRSDRQLLVGTVSGSVSPAYGYIGSALVKCSNDGGPGPRYNRKEDPGSSIFSMLVVYGFYLHLLTSSENQVAGRISGDPLPPLQTNLG
jgi:hypothetical protein